MQGNSYVAFDVILTVDDCGLANLSLFETRNFLELIEDILLNHI